MGAVALLLTPLLMLLLLLTPLQAAHAGSVELPSQLGFGAGHAVPVKSVRELRSAATVRQQQDFSCGSAALATLLTHHYATPTSEQAVFDAMWQQGDREQIRRAGFSLLDMKRHLEALGFAVDGFETTVAALADAGVPAIVLVNQNGYHHFVVVKGLHSGRVLFGDPASDTRAMPLADFEAMRAGTIALVVTDRPGRFNDAADWRARPAAPLASQSRAAAGIVPWLRLERSDL